MINFAIPKSLVVALAMTTASAGCLTNTYQIPRGELVRLSQVQPEARGQSVRVIQNLSTTDDPPGAEPVTAETQVLVVLPIHIRVGGGGRGPRPGPRPAPVSGGGSSHGSSSGGSSSSDADALSAVAVAAAVLVVATTGLIIIAATEGARFDGHVQLHPMMPVHLYGYDGGYTVMPLAAIDAETARWAERAVVVEDEGPWLELSRAPLNRQGLTYNVLMGASSSVSADGTLGYGFGSHLQLGYYPTHQFGILADVALSWRDNAVNKKLFDLRYGVELQFYPLDLGKLKGGIFGNAAFATRLEDGIVGGDTTGTALGGGAQLQLEITTRLALTGRLGLTLAHGEVTREAMLGLSVY